VEQLINRANFLLQHICWKTKLCYEKVLEDFCDFPSCFSLQRGGGGLQELTAANTLNLYQDSGKTGKIFTQIFPHTRHTSTLACNRYIVTVDT
jgi:hypothetical protein